MKDKTSIPFAVVSFVMAFAFNQLFNKLTFKIRIARNPHERKREYVKRVFYLSDYAKELRLNPEVSGVLFDRFEEANEEVYQVEKKNANRRFFLSFMRRYVSNSFFSDVLYISYLVFQATVRKALSFSSVAILYNSFGRLKRGMSIFTDVYPFACETSLYVQKLRDFLDYEPKIVSEKGLLPAEGAKEIELQGVSFAYRKEDGNLLKDISLHIRPGQKIALVGYNGAGKTTLVKLLMRLYDVGEGRILADGVDIRDYQVEKYRESIGTVFQDFKIFAGNVRENVLMNVAENCEEEPIRQALSESGLLDRVQEME
ncbi:MAG: ABC transporter ATP-binding protein/permease, partial [Acetatifactor sp.]|nr:ABC transporter ATP-binding protein/permease [Acetatifactor sp.]